jgi:hypothetical protein
VNTDGRSGCEVDENVGVGCGILDDATGGEIGTFDENSGGRRTGAFAEFTGNAGIRLEFSRCKSANNWARRCICWRIL